MSCRTFLLVSLDLFLLLGAAQADTVSPLTCNFTQMSDGFFKYQLSEPLPSPSCETYWVDDNKVVIARDSIFNANLTVLLTNHFIILRICSDHLHYTRECNENHEDVDCRVNCSGLLKPRPITAVNSTLTCFVKGGCPSLPVSVGVFGSVALVAGIIIVGCIMWRRRRRGHQPVNDTVSYRAADQVKVETV